MTTKSYHIPPEEYIAMSMRHNYLNLKDKVVQVFLQKWWQASRTAAADHAEINKDIFVIFLVHILDQALQNNYHCTVNFILFELDRSSSLWLQF